MVMVGDGMALDCTVIAEAPNMATRRQGLAKRNGILVSALKGINGLTLTSAATGLLVENAAPDADTNDMIAAPVLIRRGEEISRLPRAKQGTKDDSAAMS